MIKIEPYSEDMYEDVVRIFAKARVNDRLIFGKDTEAAVQLHIEKSCEMNVVYIDKEPVAIFGLTDRLPMGAYRYQAYIVGTDKLFECKKSFVSIGRERIKGWREKYCRLYIMTWHFYEQSFTMTKAFGFKLKMNLGDFDIYVKESV